MTDLTALSFWFPLIEAAGVPVPKTKIIEMSADAQKAAWEVFDGNDPGEAVDPFFAEIAAAAGEMGYPCFLRTDHTSGKHNWKDTCFLPSADQIRPHVWSIIEYSEMAGFPGLPWRTWAVREFLPTMPYGKCPGFGDMPVCKEFRFFVDDGAVRCFHPYWPAGALEQGGAESVDFTALCTMDNEADLRALAEAAGRAVGGSWSIDILETDRGWFVTDMAEAGKSYHWQGCPSA